MKLARKIILGLTVLFVIYVISLAVYAIVGHPANEIWGGSTDCSGPNPDAGCFGGIVGGDYRFQNDLIVDSSVRVGANPASTHTLNVDGGAYIEADTQNFVVYDGANVILYDTASNQLRLGKTGASTWEVQITGSVDVNENVNVDGDLCFNGANCGVSSFNELIGLITCETQASPCDANEFDLGPSIDVCCSYSGS